MNNDNNVVIKMLPGGDTNIITVRHETEQFAQDLLEKIAIVISSKGALTIGPVVLNGAHIISALMQPKHKPTHPIEIPEGHRLQ